MSLEKRRKLNPKCEYKLWCEWQDCNEFYDDLTQYLQHVHLHCNQNNDYSSSDLACNWTGCGEIAFNNESEFKLHLSFHGFHHKLMSFGLNVMKEIAEKTDNNNLVCMLDGSARNVLPQLPSEFVCGWNNCFTTFLDAESFYRHVETHAFDDIAIPSLSKDELKKTKFASCSWVNCKSSFISRSHLKEHLRSHTQEKLMACPGCGAMFSTKAKFTDHLFRQTSLPNKAEDISSLTLHLRNKDNSDQVTTLTIQMPQDGSDVAERSLILQNLNGDNEVMLIDLANATLESTRAKLKTFSCPHCINEFPTQSLLREHIRRHIHNHKCEICGMTTSSPSALKHHITYRHRTERPFNCQICQYSFKSKSDLRRHIDTHNQEDPYKCSVCNFQSRCAQSVATHHKEVHEDTKSVYACNECSKTFSRGNNLTRHLVTTHKYTLPPGQSKFQYQKQADGSHRLVMKTIVGIN